MVRYALLGLLREQRDYGYHLKRRFDERVGGVWHLNIGQVYQTLRALQRAGLVAAVDTPDEDSQPARRLFELTAKGLRTLERWLQRPPTRPRPVRDEILIRLLLLESASPDEALARVAAQEHLYKRHLARLLVQKRRLGGPLDRSLLVGRLGIEAALLHTEAHLKWLEYCRQELLEAPEANGDEATEHPKETPRRANAPAKPADGPSGRETVDEPQAKRLA